MTGWLLLGLPAPGSQGSSQGLVFKATTSLGIFPRGVPRPGDWEQRDSFYWVPVRPTWKVGLALPQPGHRPLPIP